MNIYGVRFKKIKYLNKRLNDMELTIIPTLMISKHDENDYSKALNERSTEGVKPATVYTLGLYWLFHGLLMQIWCDRKEAKR